MAAVIFDNATYQRGYHYYVHLGYVPGQFFAYADNNNDTLSLNGSVSVEGDLINISYGGGVSGPGLYATAYDDIDSIVFAVGNTYIVFSNKPISMGQWFNYSDSSLGDYRANWMTGTSAVDILTGSANPNVFYFAAENLVSGSRDTVTDYTPDDRLRFSGVNPGAVHLSSSGSDTLVSIDIGGGQSEILLSGSTGDVTIVFGPQPSSAGPASDSANTISKVFDIGNTHSYTTLATAYDALSRVDYIDMLNDDGIRIFTDFDQANARGDTSTRTTYDNLGRVDIVDVRNDDGTRVFTDFDQGSTRADISTQTIYDDLGRTDIVDVRNDNGTRVYTDFDQGNTRADASTLTAYDNLGRADYVDVRSDIGTRVFTDFDQADARADTSTLTAYDSLGRIDYVDVRNDSGARVFTDFDQAGTRADASTRTLYDSLGRVDIVDVLNDDGSRVFTDFDQADTNATASTRTVYDSLSRIDYIDIRRDDGSRQFTDLDQAGIYSWSSTRTEYGANGTVISVTTIPD